MTLGLKPHDRPLMEALSALPDKALGILIERLTKPDRDCEVITAYTDAETTLPMGPDNPAGCLVGLSLTHHEYYVAIGALSGSKLSSLAVFEFPGWMDEELGGLHGERTPLPQPSVDRLAWMLEMERDRRQGRVEVRV